MATEVEVRTRVDALNLLETEGEVVLNISCGVGIVGQLVVVVEAVVVVAEAQGTMPCHTCILPLVPPIHLSAGLHEELHLHLLELSHTEDKLTSHDLVTEGLTYLSDTEGELHTASLLHVEVVHEDTLRGLGTEVNGARTISR